MNDPQSPNIPPSPSPASPVIHILGPAGVPFCGAPRSRDGGMPDWPLPTPLGRSIAYCPNCLKSKLAYHAACEHGYRRAQVNRAGLARDQARPMVTCWEAER